MTVTLAACFNSTISLHHSYYFVTSNTTSEPRRPALVCNEMGATSRRRRPCRLSPLALVSLLLLLSYVGCTCRKRGRPDIRALLLDDPVTTLPTLLLDLFLDVHNPNQSWWLGKLFPSVYVMFVCFPCITPARFKHEGYSRISTSAPSPNTQKLPNVHTMHGNGRTDTIIAYVSGRLG